ncbi:hypothetical protein ACOMHN_051049 [Nucella lapillus]
MPDPARKGNVACRVTTAEYPGAHVASLLREAATVPSGGSRRRCGRGLKTRKLSRVEPVCRQAVFASSGCPRQGR